MDPGLYGRAMEDNAVVLGEYIEELEKESEHIDELNEREHTHILHRELTPNGNTILHVTVQFGHLNNVMVVLQVCPDLLLCQNKKHETPFHMAAREGRADIVEELMKLAGPEKLGDSKVKDTLKVQNINGDTALHVAARNCHLDKYVRVKQFHLNEYTNVVKLLAEGDPDFQHPPNNDQETPLYLAAERGDTCVSVVAALLKTCKSISYSGPDGRTALNAVALQDMVPGEMTVKVLLDQQKDLMNKADHNGWTPLHYAASNGNLPMMELFLSNCPDCWEVDVKGQHILHIAVEKNWKEVIDYIVTKPWGRYLVNQKNNEGNTPLHLLVASEHNVDKLWNHPEADHHVFNRKGMTPIGLFWFNFLETSKSNFDDTTDYTFLDPENEGGTSTDSKAHDKESILQKLENAEMTKKNVRLKAMIEKAKARLSEIQKEKDRKK
ncbi:hypothetical protein Vadar_016468 [Vaccinium darrowii]|uniref:Uncharacterized protein n=1 Tax=Vaccinium darrowii TaxID=229202 RepID=A0ACB7XS44_9ERIC|nr:hypothetical protein Vadar_016468 [Vaccinium darrowii]